MKDDWPYTRTRQQHFTAEEVALIQKAHKEKRKAASVARELGCSSRVIYTRYAELNGVVRPYRKYEQRRQEAKPKAAAKPIPARFYKSDFNPT
jgi:Zn-dependent peptidase ImmA (M78 family)